MAQSIRARRRRSHVVGAAPSRYRAPSERVARALIADPSPAARARLGFLEWCRDHGGDVTLTCRRFGISRTTFYRWRARYEPHRLASLEDRSCRPHRRRRPSWTRAEIGAVLELRRRYPRWGKDKLAVLLEDRGHYLAVSRVGRILGYLRRCGELREPRARRISARHRGWPRPYALRKPWSYRPTEPGDLVQLDTLDVRPVPGVVLKQFTARDVISRWDVLELATSATAAAAAVALGAVIERMPFPVRAVSVDGGSEFMAGFELACRDRAIRLFVLPPRSPKLHGAVERANRTHTEEFYECSDAEPTREALAPELRSWEDVYNTIRPHQALGYLTPRQFLDRWNEVVGGDAVSRG